MHKLHCLADTRISKDSHKMCKEIGMHGSEGNLEQIFEWKMGRKESIQKACGNVGG